MCIKKRNWSSVKLFPCYEDSKDCDEGGKVRKDKEPMDYQARLEDLSVPKRSVDSWIAKPLKCNFRGPQIRLTNWTYIGQSVGWSIYTEMVQTLLTKWTSQSKTQSNKFYGSFKVLVARFGVWRKDIRAPDLTFPWVYRLHRLLSPWTIAQKALPQSTRNQCA